VIPGMVVIAPCDAIEAKKATIALAEMEGYAYIRFTREKTPIITNEKDDFEIGKAEILWEPKTKAKNFDVAIISCGPLTYNAILAAKSLEQEKIKAIVINCHTIKPIDEKAILTAAKKCGAIVTVEEHNVVGGLGSAVAEVVVKNHPIPMEFIGMQDTFGESGKMGELIEKYGMAATDIVKAAKRVIKRK
jgi:transketolase